MKRTDRPFGHDQVLMVEFESDRSRSLLRQRGNPRADGHRACNGIVLAHAPTRERPHLPAGCRRAQARQRSSTRRMYGSPLESSLGIGPGRFTTSAVDQYTFGRDNRL